MDSPGITYLVACAVGFALALLIAAPILHWLLRGGRDE